MPLLPAETAAGDRLKILSSSAAAAGAARDLGLGVFLAMYGTFGSYRPGRRSATGAARSIVTGDPGNSVPVSATRRCRILRELGSSSGRSGTTKACLPSPMPD